MGCGNILQHMFFCRGVTPDEIGSHPAPLSRRHPDDGSVRRERFQRRVGLSGHRPLLVWYKYDQNPCYNDDQGDDAAIRILRRVILYTQALLPKPAPEHSQTCRGSSGILRRSRNRLLPKGFRGAKMCKRLSFSTPPYTTPFPAAKDEPGLCLQPVEFMSGKRGHLGRIYGPDVPRNNPFTRSIARKRIDRKNVLLRGGPDVHPVAERDVTYNVNPG